MAKATKKAGTSQKDVASDLTKKTGFSRQQKVILGTLLLLFSIALALSFISFYIYGQQDQSAMYELGNRSVEVRNWLGKFGAYLANTFFYEFFCVASFIFVRFFFLTVSFFIFFLSFI